MDSKHQSRGKGQGKPPETSGWRLPVRHYWAFILAILLVSALIHILSVIELGRYVQRPKPLPAPSKAGSVKFKVSSDKAGAKKKKQAAEPPPDMEIPKKIIEMPQTATAKPQQADHVGVVNHQALKEMRVAERLKREKAADAGQKGKPTPPKLVTQQPANPAKPEQPKPAGQSKPMNAETTKSKAGSLSMAPIQRKPRNAYEALLPTNAADLSGQMNAGFQDFVDDKVVEGDRIDMNTTEYRYIGYFTSMRKAIELVWNYPMDAARKGEQGEVGLEFIIARNGDVDSVRVLKTSGFAILDQAVVEAIKNAAPFPPLPAGFRKDRLVIVGGFRYVLGGF